MEAAGRPVTIRSMVAYELATETVNAGVRGWAKADVERVLGDEAKLRQRYKRFTMNLSG